MDQVSDRSPHSRNVKAGIALIAFTLVYMTVEAAIALWAGFHDRSVSLEAFGVDTIIEWGMAAVLLWRLSVEAKGADQERLEAVERRANWWVGLAFYALAAYIVLNSGWAFWAHERSTPSYWGIGLAVAAVIVMPVLATAKRRVGEAIGSEALKAEASCTMICGYMSVILLLGLTLTRFLGWWWADPVAALGILYWVVGEGRESFERAAHGTRCGCSGT